MVKLDAKIKLMLIKSLSCQKNALVAGATRALLGKRRPNDSQMRPSNEDDLQRKHIQNAFIKCRLLMRRVDDYKAANESNALSQK